MRRRRAGMVSVVVTAYNRKRHISECLDSLARQSYANIEVIVVDDASTDGTWQTIQRWKRRTQYRRLTAIRLPRNIGYAGALSTGLSLARGKYIAIQDSDDLSFPERLERQVRYLRQHHEVGLVGTDYCQIHNGKRMMSDTNWLRFGWDTIRQCYAEGGHCICFGTILMRGEVYDKVGGLNCRIDGAEDYEWVARCVEHGIQADNLAEVLYVYRRHAGQRSNVFYRNM